MKQKSLLPLVLFIIGLASCGKKQKKTTMEPQNVKYVNLPVADQEKTRVSFFDDESNSFEDVETFVLDDTAELPEHTAAKNATLTWQEPETSHNDMLTILFDYDSPKPRADQTPLLDVARKTVKEWSEQGKKVVFKGHSCLYHGAPDYNIALSNQRAAELAACVCQDIPEHMVQYFGVGNEEPIVVSDNKEENAPNRRVEIYPS